MGPSVSNGFSDIYCNYTHNMYYKIYKSQTKVKVIKKLLLILYLFQLIYRGSTWFSEWVTFRQFIAFWHVYRQYHKYINRVLCNNRVINLSTDIKISFVLSCDRVQTAKKKAKLFSSVTTFLRIRYKDIQVTYIKFTQRDSKYLINYKNPEVPPWTKASAQKGGLGL